MTEHLTWKEKCSCEGLPLIEVNSSCVIDFRSPYLAQNQPKTKSNEVERSFCNLDEFVFEYFYDSWKKIAFANFFHEIAFRSMIEPFRLADT